MELAQKASTHLLNSASGSERIKLALLPHAAFQVEFVFDVLHPPRCLVSRLAPTPPLLSIICIIILESLLVAKSCADKEWSWFGKRLCPLSWSVSEKAGARLIKNHRILNILVLKL